MTLFHQTGKRLDRDPRRRVGFGRARVRQPRLFPFLIPDDLEHTTRPQPSCRRDGIQAAVSISEARHPPLSHACQAVWS